jgi:hypothetical protein
MYLSIDALEGYHIDLDAFKHLSLLLDISHQVILDAHIPNWFFRLNLRPILSCAQHRMRFAITRINLAIHHFVFGGYNRCSNIALPRIDCETIGVLLINCFEVRHYFIIRFSEITGSNLCIQVLLQLIKIIF